MRRQHIHEDADEGYELLAGDAPWYCEICGEWERNRDGWDGAPCYRCQHLRGSWQCECGMINQAGSGVCQECGRERVER